MLSFIIDSNQAEVPGLVIFSYDRINNIIDGIRFAPQRYTFWNNETGYKG